MFFRLKKINLIILLIFLSLLLNPVFSCNLTAPDLGIGIVDFIEGVNSGNEITFICHVTDNHVFFGGIEIEPNNCQGKIITLKLSDSLAFEMSESIHELKISGVNVLELNGKDINVNVENDETIDPFVSTFFIDVPLIKQSTGISEINILEKERPLSNTQKGPFGVKFQFSDVNVSEGASLNINVFAGNGTDDVWKNNVYGTQDIYFYNHFLDLYDSDDLLNDFSYFYNNFYNNYGDGINGGKVVLEGDNFNNFGLLNLVLISGDGGSGNEGSKDKTKNGGIGGIGGILEFYIGNMLNYGTFNIDLNSGSGGYGGGGSGSGSCGHHNGWDSGPGGHGGLVFLDMNNIYNFDNLSLNVFSGNGGYGAKGGRGRGCYYYPRRPGAGGHGGHGGIIYIDEINDLYNNSDFDLELSAGFGGNGGSDGDHGGSRDKGNGGYGGWVSDLNITQLINSGNHSNFNIDILSGKLGLMGVNGNNGSNGKTGSTGDINIKFLENKSENFKIETKLNESIEDFVSSNFCCDYLNTDELPNSGNITIEYLDSGSYLPNILKSINNNPIDTTFIDIDSCYINSATYESLVYKSGMLNINAVNIKDIRGNFDTVNSEIGLFLEDSGIECPYCDLTELNSPLRLDLDYSLYSNFDGNISAYDLNIYYSTESNANEIFNLPNSLDVDYVIYTNESPIIAEVSEFDSSLYEYKLKKDLLLYLPEDRILGNDERLYCPAQQYIIKAKITPIGGGTKKEIQFPFVPLFS